MYVSPHMFISQKFEEFGLKKVEFDLDHNSLDFIVIPSVTRFTGHLADTTFLSRSIQIWSTS
jgi:hypothetical protein